MIVTFDFDLTLSFPKPDGMTSQEWNETPVEETTNIEFLNLLKTHLDVGDEVHIVTSRNENSFSRHEIKSFLLKHLQKEIPIWHTDGQLKAHTLKHIGSEMHYDDDPEEIVAAKKAGIKSVNAFNADAETAYERWFQSL